MTDHMRTWTLRCWNVGVVAGLLGLAYWGHETRWKIPSFGAVVHGEQAPKKETKEPRGEASTFGPIEFESAEVVRQVGIECQKAEQRDLDLIVQANATVGYDQTKVTQISSRVAGFIAKVHVQQGQCVKKGDVLALIDSPEVGVSRTELLQEFSGHFFANKRLTRLQGLAEQGAVAESTLRDAEIAVLETRSRRFSAQQKLLNLGLDIDLALFEKHTPEELARRIQTLGIPDSLVSQLDAIPKSANLIPLLAPSSGVLTQYDLVVGKRVTPDRSDIEIVDVRTMWVRLNLRKEDAGRLALGQPVRYSGAAANGSPREGKLVFISTLVDEKTRTVQARLHREPVAGYPVKEKRRRPLASSRQRIRQHVRHHRNHPRRRRRSQQGGATARR